MDVDLEYIAVALDQSQGNPFAFGYRLLLLDPNLGDTINVNVTK
jgi:hypothetical protein